jgi:VIT family
MYDTDPSELVSVSGLRVQRGTPIIPALLGTVQKERLRHQALRVFHAAVLGANDGLVSVSALLMGVGGANSDRHMLLLTGISGLVGGALSMAAGMAACSFKLSLSSHQIAPSPTPSPCNAHASPRSLETQVPIS